MAQLERRGTVGALLALLAHDLRNPLSALHSNIGFLESTLGSADPDARDALTDVGASCGSLKHIIDNLELLGLTLLEDLPALEPVPISLWEVTYEAVQRLEPIAESYGATVQFVAERQHSPRVLAHRDMFGRALSNLLFNSIQNGGSGAPVSVALARDGADGVIIISDGGPKLSEALRTSAFSAEGQLLSKADPKGRYSRGLGLFAAATAAELGGAQVAADLEATQNVFMLRAPIA